MDVYIHIFLTSALAGGEWSGSRPGRFTPGTHWIGSWVGPRVGLGSVEMRKFLTNRASNSDPSVVQPVASRYTNYGIPAPFSMDLK
jgi:hypothetical protein